MFTILKDDDPELTRPCEEVTRDEILEHVYQEYVDAMRGFMKMLSGVGFSAPQIGLRKRIIVMEDTLERMAHLSPERRTQLERDPFDFITIYNPTYEANTNRTFVYFEGCISSPGKMGVVERPAEILVQGTNRFGDRIIFIASGWKARIACHEIDHLNGILFHAKAFPESIMTFDEFKANGILRNASSDDLKSLYC